MIRRILIALHAIALMILAVQFLALTLFCLADIVLTHHVPWLFLLADLFVAVFIWFARGSMKRIIARDSGEDEVRAGNLSSSLPPSANQSRVGERKIPGFEPIRQFVRWFWRIGGLDDTKSSLLLTPFGGWFMALLGSPLLVSALVIFIRTELFLHRSISAEGTVTRLVADHDEAVHYAPAFAFTAQDGSAISIQSTSYSAPPEFQVGEKVSVLYEKGHPDHARIATHWQVHAPEDVLGMLGLFFAGVGFGSLIYQQKRSPRDAGLRVGN